MRDVSLWVEFLIYTSFTLLAISYVLYYSNIISSRERIKIDVSNIQNTLVDIYVSMITYKNCRNCLTSVSGRLPDYASLYLFNNSDIIYIMYYASYNYTPSRVYTNLTVNKMGNMFEYNFSIKVPLYFLDYSNISFSNDFCLTINTSSGRIYLSKCK
ncbi:hypothetical protein BA065_01915 [Nanoarchaeota archaeon NZ13-N]|nr:MAG: hypothetical protein BA065_01915 [Nanoarchaeota archaeon NZ13-N]